MNGIEFLRSLNPSPGRIREGSILQAVKDGLSAPFDWVWIDSKYNGHVAKICVTADALRIGTEDSVRVSVNARTAQEIADHFGCYLPTTKICDLCWGQAVVHLEPCLFGEPRSATSRMLDYHQAVEKKVAGRSGLIEVVGKHWVITNKLLSSPGRVANYGFYSAKAPNVSASGERMWQTLGLAHNASHVDYSQVVRLVSDTVVVDGRSMRFAEVATDPELAGLVSSEGVLKTLKATPVSAAVVSLPSAPPTAAVRQVTAAQLRAIPLPLTQGARGQHVESWQAFLRIRDDGNFGPITAGATEAFRLSQGLGKGRAVDAATLASALDELARRQSSPSTLVSIDAFVQAKGFNRANRDVVHWIVLHTMEASEKGTTAEAVAEYFRTTDKGSAHFCIDVDSVVGCVRLEDIAWGAPGANRYGAHLEHAGFARQTAAEWQDDYSQAMLARSAAVAVQRIQTRFGMPTQFIDRDKLKAAKKILDAGQKLPDGLRGVTTHHEVSQAFKLSTHYDPGPHFPMAQYLELMRKAG